MLKIVSSSMIALALVAGNAVAAPKAERVKPYDKFDPKVEKRAADPVLKTNPDAVVEKLSERQADLKGVSKFRTEVGTSRGKDARAEILSEERSGLISAARPKDVAEAKAFADLSMERSFLKTHKDSAYIAKLLSKTAEKAPTRAKEIAELINNLPEPTNAGETLGFGLLVKAVSEFQLVLAKKFGDAVANISGKEIAALAKTFKGGNALSNLVAIYFKATELVKTGKFGEKTALTEGTVQFIMAKLNVERKDAEKLERDIARGNCRGQKAVNG